jgi:GAF domain-containing protein
VERLPPSAFRTGALATAAERALETARQTLEVRRTALFWLDDVSSRLSCVATASTGGAERWLGQSLAAGVGMAGRAVREDRPVWTPDLLADPRVPLAPWLRDRLEEEGLRTVAAAPIRIGGVVLGALGFLDGPGRIFDDAGLRRCGDRAAEGASARATAIRAATEPGTG